MGEQGIRGQGSWTTDEGGRMKDEEHREQVHKSTSHRDIRKSEKQVAGHRESRVTGDLGWDTRCRILVDVWKRECVRLTTADKSGRAFTAIRMRRRGS